MVSNAAEEEEEAAAAAVEEVGDMCIWMRMRMAAIKCAAAPSFDVGFLVFQLHKAPNGSGEQCGMGLLRNRRGR